MERGHFTFILLLIKDSGKFSGTSFKGNLSHSSDLKHCMYILHGRVMQRVLAAESDSMDGLSGPWFKYILLASLPSIGLD